MIKTQLTLLVLCAVLMPSKGRLLAQSTPTMGAAQFSNGVHSTFDAIFPDAEVHTVEAFWKAELKAISTRVSNKKELTGEAARIPTATPDTLRIMVKVEKAKGTSVTTAHIAFLTTSGYVGPDSELRLRDGCTAWVQQRTLTLQRQVAQQAMDNGNRELQRQQQLLEALKREQVRAEDGILKAGQRNSRAMQDKEAAQQELDQLQQYATTAQDTTLAPAESKELNKQRAKLQDKIKRLSATISAATKRTEDLHWTLKQNADRQVEREKAVQRQQAAADKLKEKLQDLR